MNDPGLRGDSISPQGKFRDESDQSPLIKTEGLGGEGLGIKSRLEVYSWASLGAQWLRIRLPMQGTQVRTLVWEDPTCRGATGPVSHNY